MVLVNAFIRTVILRGGLREVAILCDMHRLILVGIFGYLSMNDILPGFVVFVVVAVVVI